MAESRGCPQEALGNGGDTAAGYRSFLTRRTKKKGSDMARNTEEQEHIQANSIFSAVVSSLQYFNFGKNIVFHFCLSVFVRVSSCFF